MKFVTGDGFGRGLLGLDPYPGVSGNSGRDGVGLGWGRGGEGGVGTLPGPLGTRGGAGGGGLGLGRDGVGGNAGPDGLAGGRCASG